ncbi:MAG: glutathione metabolism protein [Comamonadaceae bacterium CG1_02_60_18]|nr:MAG: glutathione metabolism protein [Comamonadaceae bacterium CG1_02_60_18]PIQ51359.1 MAG: glutathione metabolism protein [Comamonadaceae bacterium CG12_big_fil_rev_8_21_14_0_65_59_15]
MTTHFTLAYWCVLVVALLPIVCAGVAKWGSFGKRPSDGGFDNENPRAWLARQTDWRARANAAQANSFEAMPFFIGAVVIAHQLGAYQARVDLLALVYVVLRVVFVLLYLANLANLRSLVWGLALAVNVAILFAGYR